jgi:hypothetical protein
MKRKLKLRLHRETLRNLEAGDLRLANGGGTTQQCDQASDCVCASEGCVGTSLQSLCESDRCSYYGNCSSVC